MFPYQTNELLIYLRKSQADSPMESVEEVLRKHEYILQDFAVKLTGQPLPEHQIFREVVSGETIEARIEMQKLLKLIESPEIKAVLVVDPQRLSRGDLVDCGTVINAFRYTNTQIITPTKTFDLTEKYDRKFLEMELQHGADYLEYCKEILYRGRLASVMRGNYIGSIAPYGYQKVSYKEGNEKIFTLEIDEVEAPAVQIAFDLYANQGYSFYAISRKLDELGYRPRHTRYWSTSAIRDILSNEVYAGMIRWGWRKTEKNFSDGKLKLSRPKQKEYTLISGRHPAIIDMNLFRQCQERRGKNARVAKKEQIRNPFSGIIFCQCGRAMSYRTYFRNGKERSAPRLLCDDQIHCKTASCTFDEMYALIINILKDSIRDFRIITENQENDSHITDTIHSLELRLSDLQSKEIKLWEKYTEEDMPKNIFDALLEKHKTETASIEKKLHALQQEDKREQDYQKQIIKFSEALHALQDPDMEPGTKNILLKECIDKIIYSRKTGTGEKRDTTNPNMRHARWNPNQIQLDVFLRQ